MWQSISDSGLMQDYPFLRGFGYDGFPTGKAERPRYPAGIALTIPVEGRLEFVVDGKVHSVGPGEAILRYPWQLTWARDFRFFPGRWMWFEIVPDEFKESGRLRCGKWCDLSTEEQDEMGRVLVGAKSPRLGHVPALQATMTELASELYDTKLGHATRVRHLTSNLLLQVCRAIQNPPVDDTSRIPWIKRAVDQMIADPVAKWSLADLCAIAQTSKSALINGFKEVTGYAPGRYLNMLRIDRACHLLLTTEKSVTEIAFDIGMSSSQYFATVFKSHMGTTPGLYRRGHPAGNPNIPSLTRIGTKGLLRQGRKLTPRAVAFWLGFSRFAPFADLFKPGADQKALAKSFTPKRLAKIMHFSSPERMAVAVDGVMHNAHNLLRKIEEPVSKITEKMAKFSAKEFSAMFEEATGRSPAAFRASVRTEADAFRNRADQLLARLAESNDPPRKIAEELGYKSYKDFTRDVRRASGTTPAQYIRQMRHKA